MEPLGLYNPAHLYVRYRLRELGWPNKPLENFCGTIKTVHLLEISENDESYIKKLMFADNLRYMEECKMYRKAIGLDDKEKISFKHPVENDTDRAGFIEFCFDYYFKYKDGTMTYPIRINVDKLAILWATMNEERKKRYEQEAEDIYNIFMQQYRINEEGDQDEDIEEKIKDYNKLKIEIWTNISYRIFSVKNYVFNTEEEND